MQFLSKNRNVLSQNYTCEKTILRSLSSVVQFVLLLFIAGKDLESENVDRKDMMLPGKQLQLLQDVVSMSESCFHGDRYLYM